MINHWLLNAAAEFGVPLTCIFPAASRGLNVKPVPRCDSEQYSRGLLELFDSAQIAFSSKVPGDDPQTRNGVAQILDRFRVLSKQDSVLGLLPTHRLTRLPGMNVCFKLTPLGGETWQKIAQPDWTHYVSVRSDMNLVDIVSANRDLLFAYLGWFSELQGQRVLRESINWQTHTDFNIVYWKRLPLVHHASFRVQSEERTWPQGEPQWFRECRNSIRSWYTTPRDLSDWPSE